MKIYYYLALILSIQISPILAHVDDSGDIHPRVTIKDKQFIVYYKNSIFKKQYKTTIAIDGKIIKSGEVTSDLPADALPLKLPEEQTGINILRPDAYYVIPEWKRKHNGKPYILQLKQKQQKRINLAWGKTKIDQVHGAAFSNNAYILNASRLLPDDRDINTLSPFYFYVFSQESKKLIHTSKIGYPIRIYDFPRSSEVIHSNGYAYLAWMGSDDNQKSILNLTQLNPATGKTVTRKICAGNWNSSPSIGIIEDNILIAYHKKSPPNDRLIKEARIMYQHRMLNEIFNN